ncbi:hypothetical protein CTV96_09670 [Bacillus altitudinis]|uniref:hypothetical protein n=1 Tax=Bacillus altitudinis TaxID=293387 RepID=UPI000C236589|nr:hypothetical protein [Bacillus altitudinis]PJI12404.1 hypothetical protein CTV96_09670 [Bacillus altitudinis]PKQ85581.1 hypothetical protein CTV98_007425 [Bacillus altitudinis]
MKRFITITIAVVLMTLGLTTPASAASITVKVDAPYYTPKATSVDVVASKSSSSRVYYTMVLQQQYTDGWKSKQSQSGEFVKSTPIKRFYTASMTNGQYRIKLTAYSNAAKTKKIGAYYSKDVAVTRW